MHAEFQIIPVIIQVGWVLIKLTKKKNLKKTLTTRATNKLHICRITM